MVRYIVYVDISKTRQGGKEDCQPAAGRMVEVGRVVDQLSFPLNVAAGIESRGLNPGCEKMPVSSESEGLYSKIVEELSQAFLEWKMAPAASLSA